ncbi:MAG: choice-of-anchor B family protein [candidate division Zixibacteria bacterium]|nr:choice-of-anchor B family protein [candidate division Zixibacteria bacterium]
MIYSSILMIILVVCLLTFSLSATPKIPSPPTSDVHIIKDPLSQLSSKYGSGYRVSDLEALERGFSAQSPVAGAGPTYLLCNLAIYDFSGRIDTEQVNVGGTDVWGWRSPDGDDYALMGTKAGIAIVNATRLAFITEFPLPVTFGGQAFWRDIKTYRNYLYAVSDLILDPPGLTILDLQYLPDSVHFVGNLVMGPLGNDSTSHNIFVDTITGFLYAEGNFGNGKSIYIYDLADPENPVFVKVFGPGGIHDLYANNDTLYVAEGFSNSYSMWEMSNKLSPRLILRFSIPGGFFAHMIWPTEDPRIVATTEESPPGRTLKLLNIENRFDVQVVGEYIGPGQVPHNVLISGDTMYVSHYAGGVRVVDISDPAAPAEIGFFDTHPASDEAGFRGNWGVYPYAQDGLVFASDMKGLLFIFREMEAEFGDTLRIQTGVGLPGSEAVVEVHATTALPIRQFIIPFEWPGPYNMTLDSVSTVGTRTEDFERVTLTALDQFNKRAAYLLRRSLSDMTDFLEAGSGPILKIYFSMPFGISGESNPIRIVPINGRGPSFTTACLTVVSPALVDGQIVFGCCLDPGDANNDQSINISDVTFLIGRVFGVGAAPNCEDEADANGDNSVNIADITYLIARIFAGGPAPVCGTTAT